MQQSLCQTFKLQGNCINLNLRIEILDSTDQKEKLTSYGVSQSQNSSQTSEVDINNNCPPLWNSEDLPHEAGGVDQETGVLEKYAPHEIDTCSAHQIAWDAPSPIQDDDEGEVE
ncbi:hypothetical protein BDR05DRAFT_946517 [Suillus weaverae]|nr:hypothetical protein BDR05DRAFT_946517 [Suillus weaverae]